MNAGASAADLEASLGLVSFVASALALGLFALFQSDQKNNNDDDDSSPGGGLMQPIS